MQLNVLVVDAADGLEPISLALEREGFVVLVATTAAAALAQTHVWPPAVVIVADRLDDGSGLDVLAEMKRRNREVCVLVTGKGDADQQARALVQGADDYIIKPFSPREIATRLIALTRAHRAAASPVLDLGSLRIDLDAREVTRDGMLVDLPACELDLLIHLALHPRRTFSGEQLLRDVWSGAESYGPTGVATLVDGLRRAIEHDPLQPRVVVSIPTVGYRFEPGFADQRAT